MPRGAGFEEPGSPLEHKSADLPVAGGLYSISDFWIASGLFLIESGLYSVTALRRNDQKRVTVYTKHLLQPRSQTTEA